MERHIQAPDSSNSSFLAGVYSCFKVDVNTSRKVRPKFLASFRAQEAQHLTCHITLPKQNYYFKKLLFSFPSHHLGWRYMGYIDLRHFKLTQTFKHLHRQTMDAIQARKLDTRVDWKQLKCWTQRAAISSLKSSWTLITSHQPHELTPGLILFNIFTSGLGIGTESSLRNSAHNTELGEW